MEPGLAAAACFAFSVFVAAGRSSKRLQRRACAGGVHAQAAISSRKKPSIAILDIMGIELISLTSQIAW